MPAAEAGETSGLNSFRPRPANPESTVTESVFVGLYFLHTATEQRIHVIFCTEIIYGPESDIGYFLSRKNARFMWDNSSGVNCVINGTDFDKTCYTGKLFTRGFKKDLEDDDLYEVVDSCSSKKCGDKLEKAFKIEERKGKPPIMKVIWKVYGCRYVGLGVLHLIWNLINNIVEPETISKLVAYYKPGQTDLSFHDALFYASIMIGLKLFGCFYFHNYFIYLYQLAIQMKAAFCSLMYRKALRMSPRALARISLGKIVTVITKDLQFENSIWLFNDLWIAVVQTCVAFYLIYNKIGFSSTFGVTILALYIPVQVQVSRMIKRMRLKINQRTDKRLQITQETLSIIRIIKMYTWEKFFGERINEARKEEMNQLLKTAFLRMSLGACSILVSNLAFYALIMAYIWQNSTVSTENMFYVMRCFGTLQHSLGMKLSMGFARLAELVASLQRVETILNEEELPEYIETADDEPQIEFKNVSLHFNDKKILQNITLTFQQGLNIVTGQLGCGKSSLLKIALRNYPLDAGEIITKGTCSYASQDPWLFPATIKQNILFGEKYNAERYNRVVDICALTYDFNLLEKGDDTIVADRGLNLSKGQQTRINLARAVYKEADIYFIDDALAALDSRVQEQIFNNCIKDFLKDKLVVLVTHNAQHIRQADQVFILDGGSIKFEGKQEDFTGIVLEATEEELKPQKVETTNEQFTINEKTNLIEPVKPRKRAVYQEIKKEGGIDFVNYVNYFKAGGSLLFLFVAVLFVLSTVTFGASHKMITNWINQQQQLTIIKESMVSKLDNYGAYLNSSDLGVTFLFNETTTFLSLVNTTIEEASSVLLAENQRTSLPPLNTTEYDQLESQATNSLTLYSILVFATTVLELLKFYFLLKLTITASVKIHRIVVKSVLHSTMSFFDNFFIGNILNRFSQDLSVVDERLPFMLSHLLNTVFAVGGMLGLIITVNWRFLIPATLVIIVLILLRYLYIPAARSLKRLEAATRSPLVGHLNSTIEGLATVRAFQAQQILSNEFDRHQDLFTSAFYTSICLRRAFSLYMDFVSICFSIYIISRFLFADDGTSAGNVGLAITQVAAMAMVMQHALMLWCDVETLMTSVERIFEFSKLEQEKVDGIEVKNWPLLGDVKYENVSLTYTNSHEKVLKYVSFSVGTKEKIGIIGRTGAGKSSLISTLFRLYNYDGEIIVDGVEMKTLSLKFLRSHISIIPQDPILFSGTIRSNVDPFAEYSDEDIWRTLHRINLDSTMFNLETCIEDINFSTGQRQLICVARAIIKQNKIVVLDEATANLDPETEDIIQKIINENFFECTVFIIAHRLQSILDCNKVMIVDKGRIVEFDNPQLLMENPKSRFSHMLKNADLVNFKQRNNVNKT